MITRYYFCLQWTLQSKSPQVFGFVPKMIVILSWTNNGKTRSKFYVFKKRHLILGLSLKKQKRIYSSMVLHQTQINTFKMQ